MKERTACNRTLYVHELHFLVEKVSLSQVDKAYIRQERRVLLETLVTSVLRTIYSLKHQLLVIHLYNSNSLYLI
jgi:hypothetical protein